LVKGMSVVCALAQLSIRGATKMPCAMLYGVELVRGLHRRAIRGASRA
jgi:hypothetical protein